MTHEGLSELKIEMTVSWDLTPCSFGGAPSVWNKSVAGKWLGIRKREQRLDV
jgi:hypothetical protein